MADDYGFSGRRKSKNDKRKKRRYGVYKVGGKYRSTRVSDGKEDGKK